MRSASPLLDLDQKLSVELERIARDKKSSKKVSQRCWIVLMAAEGISNYAIGRTLGLSRPTVVKWRQRFEFFGKDVILNESYSSKGRPLSIPIEQRDYICDEAKKFLMTEKTLRQCALELGLSKSTLHRMLNA